MVVAFSASGASGTEEGQKWNSGYLPSRFQIPRGTQVLGSSIFSISRPVGHGLFSELQREGLLLSPARLSFE